MSKTLPPAVFGPSDLSSAPKSPPSVASTTLVAKTPFLIDDILHQHHTNTPTHRHNNTSASHYMSASNGKTQSLDNCPYSPSNSTIKAASDVSAYAVNVGHVRGNGRKSSGDSSGNGSRGIFQESEQLMIRSNEEDYRRHHERYEPWTCVADLSSIFKS